VGTCTETRCSDASATNFEDCGTVVVVVVGAVADVVVAVAVVVATAGGVGEGTLAADIGEFNEDDGGTETAGDDCAAVACETGEEAEADTGEERAF
jgi:hypothetical protein